MKILQVTTGDIAGGAERIAWTLHEGYRARDKISWLAVGRKKSDRPDVLVIPDRQYRPVWTRTCYRLADALFPLAEKHRALAKVHGLVRAIGNPKTWIARQRGEEDFDFPATGRLLELPPEKPDIVHCHNLHGEYFDLRFLSVFSPRIPLILTLHDAWLLSGHCAHSLDCDRWKIGCGQCPDLTLMPAIKGDATAYNWRRKRDIYRQSKLYVATPSRWLMDKVQQSILVEGIVESRVIPNGIDLDTFYPADKNRVRSELGLPLDAKIILFTANGIRKNPWKDYQTMRTAVERVAARMPDGSIVFLALGEDSPAENIGSARIQFVPYQKDPAIIAKYYQAADLYIHAAKADTFPNTVLEALACGIPVVGTKVGGIPEQIDHGKNGFLVTTGESDAMADAIQKILENSDLQRSMREEASLKAKNHYSLQRMIEEYLDWYRSIVESRTR